MPTLEQIKKKRSKINEISALYGVRNLRVFGSVAKGTATSSSDIDLLVSLEKDRSLLDLGGFMMDLQSLLGCKVDVVTEKGLHWYLKEKILKEAKPL